MRTPRTLRLVESDERKSVPVSQHRQFTRNERPMFSVHTHTQSDGQFKLPLTSMYL